MPPESKPWRENTERLRRLFAVPDEMRNELWFEQFYRTAPAAAFRCDPPQVVQGPDGFPYAKLILPGPEDEFQPYIIEQMTSRFLLEQGLGVVITEDSRQPLWVFSHGDILNYHLHGAFDAGSSLFTPHSSDEDETLPADTFPENLQGGNRRIDSAAGPRLCGDPGENILPVQTRRALAHWLRHYYPNPMVALLYHPQEDCHELAFNCTPAKFDDSDTFREVLRQISWFLPPCYTYCAVEEENGMMPLYEEMEKV
ncbi:MAG: hypothetical protein IJD04_04310 [Desulfovibrionaceae bacterium]|nr:hypothetical protein [Desulfovibrionaceae bacterium]